jgi:hypothetical protein
MRAIIRVATFIQTADEIANKIALQIAAKTIEEQMENRLHFYILSIKLVKYPNSELIFSILKWEYNVEWRLIFTKMTRGCSYFFKKISERLGYLD